MNEPLAHSLLSVSKKYLISFYRKVSCPEIERYQYVLVLIDDNNELLSQKALAERLEIDKSYMVAILDYLTERGYVVREKNPKDRREQLIRLTPAGKKGVPVFRKAICELNQQCLKSATEQQVRTFNEVLNLIQSNLSDAQRSQDLPDLRIKDHQSNK